MLKLRVNYSSFTEKVKNTENGNTPHQPVLKNTFSAKSHLYLLGFARSRCTNNCQICGCILLLNNTNWYVHTMGGYKSTHARGQDSKEMDKNENTVVLRVVGLRAIFFLPKETFVISTEKLRKKKNNIKPSSPSQMLNLN